MRQQNTSVTLKMKRDRGCLAYLTLNLRAVDVGGGHIGHALQMGGGGGDSARAHTRQQRTPRTVRFITSILYNPLHLHPCHQRRPEQNNASHEHRVGAREEAASKSSHTLPRQQSCSEPCSQTFLQTTHNAAKYTRRSQGAPPTGPSTTNVPCPSCNTGSTRTLDQPKLLYK